MLRHEKAQPTFHLELQRVVECDEKREAPSQAGEEAQETPLVTDQFGTSFLDDVDIIVMPWLHGQAVGSEGCFQMGDGKIKPELGEGETGHNAFGFTLKDEIFTMNGPVTVENLDN